MVLRLRTEDLQMISAHAERMYPNECCGILFGHISCKPANDDRIVSDLWEVQNAWNAEAEAHLSELSSLGSPVDVEESCPTSTQADRYWIDPQDMLKAQQFARDRQMEIIGIYHSHPNHPAVPSECDRLCAWPHYSYVIASVQIHHIATIRSWILDADHQFQSEAIVTVEV